MIGFIVNGVANVFYGPSDHFGIPDNIWFSIIGLFIGGIA